jgi:uncharacterized protein (DUF4415 family)
MTTKPDTGEKNSLNYENDPDEVPPLDRDHFERAALYRGDKLIRPGRPRKAAPNVAISLRVNPAVLRGYRALGKGWQTIMNGVLEDGLRRHRAPRRVAIARIGSDVTGPSYIKKAMKKDSGKSSKPVARHAARKGKG